MFLLKQIIIGGFLLLNYNFSLANLNDSQLYEQGFYYSQVGKNNKAFKIMLHLAKHDYAIAKFNVALSYKNGLGVQKNDKLAIYWLKQAADDNVVYAVTELANFYYHGIIVKKDWHRAQQLWLKSAINGDEYAQFNLAMLLLELNKNDESYKWLLLAKNNTHPEADKALEEYFTKLK